MTGKTVTEAIRYTRHGGPEVLTLDEVPTPEPGPRQVRVRVEAVGVNAVDWKIRKGLFAEGDPDGPTGTGLDLAGVVDAVGPGAENLRAGQAVFGQATGGAAATFALASIDDVVPRPEWLPVELAAALPVITETAYRTLRQLGVSSGQTLLVHAVAGGVGLVAAQLARSWGAEVVGTASAGHHEFLRGLGVRPVTYDPDGLADRIRAAAPNGVDAVLDGSGRGVLEMSVELTGDVKKVITIADPKAAAAGVHFSSSADAVPLAEALDAVMPLLERGALSLPVERTFPLERTAEAHRLSEDGHLRGKIVLTVG